LSGTAKFRIPDFLDKANRAIGEVKNVSKLGYTKQLKDFALYADRYGLKFVLYVRKSTVLSKELQAAVQSGSIILSSVKKKERSNEYMSAEELLRNLGDDPQYLKHQKEFEKGLERDRIKHKMFEQPILSDLAQIGYSYESIDALRRSNRNYGPAIPILQKWLSLTSDPDIKESLVRALSVPWAKKEAMDSLIKEFHKVPDNQANVRWAIGNALEVLSSDDYIDQLIEIASNNRYGASRQMVVLALAKMRDRRRVIPILNALTEDEIVRAHAIAALGRLRAVEARRTVEKYINDPSPLIRKEARAALKRMDR
jgi:hypothetical protein